MGALRAPEPVAGPAARRKVTLLGLIAVTYFMVAGGPYGLEDVIQEAGYHVAVLVLLLIPFFWSLPTALMVSELSSAIPEDGGYYVWVRLALGPFWGFQEAWLSLAASIFDMAIYPILFVTYMGFTCRSLTGALGSDDFKGMPGLCIGFAMIAACVVTNLRPPRSVGRSAVLMTLAVLGPFAVLTLLAFLGPAAGHETAEPGATERDYVGALLFALWNYMGWDNATTFAGEVDRPQRTYPLAMGGAVVLVTVTYVLPVLAASRLGIAAEDWKTGYWVTVAEHFGLTALTLAVGVGGMIYAFGMFNALVLSYSRLPVVLAEDGYLPAAFTRRLGTGAPWLSIVALALTWGLAMQLGLKRVLALDVILYGLSLLLEFAALVALRLRQPQLPRPFRVPGGIAGTLFLGFFPALLIGLAIFDQAGKWTTEDDDDLVAPAPALLLGAVLALLGPVCYVVSRWLHFRRDPEAGSDRAAH